MLQNENFFITRNNLGGQLLAHNATEANTRSSQNILIMSWLTLQVSITCFWFTFLGVLPLCIRFQFWLKALYWIRSGNIGVSRAGWVAAFTCELRAMSTWQGNHWNMMPHLPVKIQLCISKICCMHWRRKRIYVHAGGSYIYEATNKCRLFIPTELK